MQLFNQKKISPLTYKYISQDPLSLSVKGEIFLIEKLHISQIFCNFVMHKPHGS